MQEAWTLLQKLLVQVRGCLTTKENPRSEEVGGGRDSVKEPGGGKEIVLFDTVLLCFQ